MDSNLPESLKVTGVPPRDTVNEIVARAGALRLHSEGAMDLATKETNRFRVVRQR